MRISRLAAAATIVFVGLGPTVASAHRAGAVLPIAKLKVQATAGGEPADIELRENGDVYLRVAPKKEGWRVARVAGSQVIANDGSVLATLRLGGYLTVRGFEKTLRLRGCSLIDDEGTELRLTPNGEFWSKPRGQPRFSLPVGVEGDFRRACPTALLLYRMLPVFIGRGAG